MPTNGIRTLEMIEAELRTATERLRALEEKRCEQINQMHELNTEISRLELQRRRLKSMGGVDNENSTGGNDRVGDVDGMHP